MKYFIDTEFIEGFKKPIKWLPTIGKFNKPYHFIDLISIGIVCEDGREYYAISNEFDPSDADDWVKENVLRPMAEEYEIFDFDPSVVRSIRNLQREYGKSNKQIANDIREFVLHPWHSDRRYGFDYRSDAEFYAYYADYDWVVFCSLFGRMIDLPKGLPMYCRDLKQMLDERAIKNMKFFAEQGLAELTFEQALKNTKGNPHYPKQENEHNALDDARWNQKLYQFLSGV